MNDTYTIKIHFPGTPETNQDTAALLTALIGPEVEAGKAQHAGHTMVGSVCQTCTEDHYAARTGQYV